MTWQTAAVRYISVGERSARFRDLTLDFTAAGEPVESVLWLPNGGGKSSLMSLMSAVVLPAQRDFTGAGRDDGQQRPRRLEDYVAGGDTSHTVIEWTAADPANLFGQRRRLLTGAAYEWQERRRPGGDQEGKLHKVWWSAVPQPGILDLQTVPARGASLRTLAQFRDRLRLLNSEHPELQVQVAITQTAWEEQLEDLGIDTSLYRYQAKMNTSEGGISRIFNFNTVRDFVDLIVDVIANPSQAEDCASVVNQHAKNLFRRPALQLERSFLAEAGTLLRELAESHQRVQATAGTLEAALRGGAALRGNLSLAATQAEGTAAAAERSAEQTGERVSENRRERGRVDLRRAELAYLAAKSRLEEAAEEVDSRRQAEASAAADQTAWAAAQPLAEAAGYQAAAAEVRDQLKPEREARDELAVRHDTVAQALRQLLAAEAADYDQQAATAAAAVSSGRHRLGQIKSELGTLRTQMSADDKESARAQGLIEDHDRALSAARRSGVLAAGENPAEAQQRHTDAAEQETARARDTLEASRGHRTRAREAADDVAGATVLLADVRGQASTAATEEQRLVTRHADLATNERLIALAEAEGKVDLWGDAAQLRSALTDAARSAEQLALTEAVESAEDDRLVDSVRSVGLLPAPTATSVAASVLAQSGVPAETAWAVLVRDYPQDAVSVAVTDRPDLVSGVVVQDDSGRQLALALLASTPTLSHIPLVTADELGRSTRGSHGRAAVPVVPLDEGLYLPAVAQAAAERLTTAGTERARRRDGHTRRAAADKQLLKQLSDFLTEFPDPASLARAAEAAAAVREQVSAAEEHLAARAAERDREDARAEELAGQSSRSTGLAAEHRGRADAARPLAEAAARLAGHRQTVERAAAALAAAGAAVSTLENEHEELNNQVGRFDLVRLQKESAAGAVRREAAAVSVVDGRRGLVADAVTDERERGLTEVRSRYEMLHAQWRSAAGASVLEERLQGLESQERAARLRSQRLVEAYDGDRARVLEQAGQRASSYSADQCGSFHRDATKAFNEAVGATALAGSELQQRQSQFGVAEQGRGTRRPAEPVPFTTAAEAEAEAERLQAESARLTSLETQLAGERDLLANQAREDRQHAESLRDLADQLNSSATTAAEDDIVAFAGTIAEARQQVRTAGSTIKVAEEALAEAERERSSLAQLGVKLIAKRDYQDITLTLRDRLADSDTAGLAGRAELYAEEVSVRVNQVDALLEQTAQDEDRVSKLVSSHVRQLLTGIADAARSSRLPTGLGEMSGKQFITLHFTNPSDDELRSRVSQRLLSLLDAAHGQTKSLPSGQSILKNCVHAAVGAKSFRAEILKPNEHMLEQRVDVTQVSPFSDGEKLTTCVLLFCAFARMRQRGRSAGGLSGATGTLLLDNPFGKASTAQLVALQLAVAHSQKVHLVYATGLEDMGALLQFRRLIRLRNRKPVGSTDGHVQLEAAHSRTGEVTGVSVGRPDAPVPVELTRPDEQQAS